MARQAPGLAPTTLYWAGRIRRGEEASDGPARTPLAGEQAVTVPEECGKWDAASMPATRSESISLQRCQRQASQRGKTYFRE